MKDAIEIGKKLKELRLSHGYTQNDVAAMADIRQATYSNYENGKCIPGSTPLYKIASLYGLTTDDLMKLCLNLDDNLFFDAATISEEGADTAEFMNFSKEENYANLSSEQKELLFFFSKLDISSRKELIEYARFKWERYRKYVSQ